MNIEIANRLYELRKQNGLSQEELAEKIGVSRQAVSKWERAESSPDTDNLIELARLYRVSLDELLFTAEPAARKSPPEGFTQNLDQGAQRSVERQEPVSIGFDEQQHKFLLKLPVPLFVAGAYLLMGFLGNLWHPGWLIFLTIPIYYQLVAMLAAKSLRKKLNLFPMAVLCVAFYLLLGFFLNLWHPGWLVLLLIPVYHWLVSTVVIKK